MGSFGNEVQGGHPEGALRELRLDAAGDSRIWPPMLSFSACWKALLCAGQRGQPAGEDLGEQACTLGLTPVLVNCEGPLPVDTVSPGAFLQP